MRSLGTAEPARSVGVEVVKLTAMGRLRGGSPGADDDEENQPLGEAYRVDLATYRVAY
jgi:hypothetical protein